MTAELRFSNDWFTHSTYGKRKHKIESSRDMFERFLLPLKSQRPSIIEIGVNEAQSSLWLLENVNPSMWLGIDPWRPGRKHHVESFRIYEQNCWHNLRASGATCPAHDAAIPQSRTEFSFRDTKCIIAKESSHDFLRGPVDAYCDDYSALALLVDGDHSSQGCLTDLVLGWRKLRPGGLILIDDFDRRWHQGRAHVHEGVLAFWMAFEHLCEKVFESRKHVVFRRKLDG
jgi:hypothetical protein